MASVVVVVVQQPALPVVGSVAAGSWMQRRSAARRSVEELPTCMLVCADMYVAGYRRNTNEAI